MYIYLIPNTIIYWRRVLSGNGFRDIQIIIGLTKHIPSIINMAIGQCLCCVYIEKVSYMLHDLLLSV